MWGTFAGTQVKCQGGSREYGRLPPTMVWNQARAKQLMNELQSMMGEGGGGRRPAGGTAGKNSKPQPPAQGETALRRERGGIALVGITILLIALCASLATKPRREGRQSLASKSSSRTKRGIHKRNIHEKVTLTQFLAILYSNFEEKFAKIALIMDTPFAATLLVLAKIKAATQEPVKEALDAALKKYSQRSSSRRSAWQRRSTSKPR